MSQENVELVRRLYELWAASDLDGMLTLTDREVEMRSLLTEAERTSYRGHQGVAEWYRALLGIFPDWNPKLERIQAFGDAVVVKLHVMGRAEWSGVPVEGTTWQVLRFS